MPSIGDKRSRITIQRQSSELNSFRQPKDEWAEVGTYWANVRTLSGRELATARQVRDEVTTRVAMRFQPGVEITPADRIEWHGRKLQILAAFDPDERMRELWLDCAEWKGAENP